MHEIVYHAKRRRRRSRIFENKYIDIRILSLGNSLAVRNVAPDSSNAYMLAVRP